MPRSAPLDAPGVLHHVMGRGIKKRPIFLADEDQNDFLSRHMLAEMRMKFASRKEIDYRVGESEHLPIPDETMDYAFANMFLHHVESPSEAIQEMVRILKPKGKLVITDLDEHTFEFLKTEHHDRWVGFKREDIRQWLIEAGLKNVVADCVGENRCAQSSCGSDYASISIFVASGEK